jgi:hypothetical protein
MRIAFATDTFLLLLVLALTLVAALNFPRNGLQATIVDQDCGSVRTWGTLLHLLINIVSTLLLATSSYAMQCLGSPTRREIDRVHDKGKCMNIGVPSIGNVIRMSPRRLLLWLLIFWSSLPIHLLANSAVYETQGANSYIVAVVEEEFISRPLSELSQRYAYIASGFNSAAELASPPSWVEDIQVELRSNTTRLLKQLVPNMERLENADCMKAYSEPLLSNRRTVIAVTSYNASLPANAKSNYIHQLYYQSVDYCPDCRSYRYYTDTTRWVCAWLSQRKDGIFEGCNIASAIDRASEWTIKDMPIEYCLSEIADGQCQLQANISIMIAVLACTLVKIAAIMVAFWIMPREIIATIGDAVASFLAVKEPLTSDCCLLSRGDVHRSSRNSRTLRWEPGKAFRKPWSARSLKKRWGSAPSKLQWLTTIVFLGALLITTISFFGAGIGTLKNNPAQASTNDVIRISTSMPAIMQMGFGVVNVNFLIELAGMSSANGVLGHILLVNTPQLVLSLSYFAYNALWTKMLIAREWAQYGIRRQSLRVSVPQGQQRSNYFLTIPYAYAAALLTISAILHWLLSQSFFLARVNVNAAEPFVTTPPAVINTVGYSLGALFIFFIVALVAVLVVVGFGIFMKLRSPMPVVGGCSLAISAACHPLNEPDGMEQDCLKWGVVGDSMYMHGNDSHFMKHCSFSAGEVFSPAELQRGTGGDDGKSPVVFA